MSDSCGGILVLGVGNVLKGDDAVGPYVVDLIATSSPPEAEGSVRGAGLTTIDCGTVPENYTSVVRRMQPAQVIIVDAADMGLEPGSVRVVPGDRVGALGLSTHSMPLSLFIDYVTGFCGEVTLVGIQPLAMRLGEGLSERVRAAGGWLAGVIRERQLFEIPRLGVGSLGDDEIR